MARSTVALYRNCGTAGLRLSAPPPPQRRLADASCKYIPAIARCDASHLALQGGCCGSGAKTIDDAELRPDKPARSAAPAAAKTQHQPTSDAGKAAAFADVKPAQQEQEQQQQQQQQQQQVPNSQQIDGLPESVPVVLPPPGKPDAVAGIPLQPAEYQTAVGQPPQPNGAATVPPTVGQAASPPSPLFSPFADNRKARTASDADRGSNGSVAGGFAANGSAATGAADGGSSGLSPFNSAASRQSSGGFSGGLKSQSFATFGSGTLGDQPATCVRLPLAAASTLCE